MTGQVSPQPIRDAAALIVIDPVNPVAPRFLLGKRHKNQIFLPDMYVFPGGRVERDDGRMNVFGTLGDNDEDALLRKMKRPSHSRTRALALAAVRECAEETGLYIGTKELGAPEKVPPLWKPFQEQGIYPTLDNLHYIARAVTPPNRVRRYDTRFFATTTEQIAFKKRGIAGKDSELTKLIWVTLEETCDLEMLEISRHIIRDAHARFMSGLERPAAIPYYFARGNQRHRIEL